MLVGEARDQARAWVAAEASRVPGFAGAFLTGSTKWQPADAPHRASSDVDVRVVVEGTDAPENRNKARYGDILLEAAFVTRESLGTAEEFVAHPHLAGSLWYPVWLADPSEALAKLARGVTARFPRRVWVDERRRRSRDLSLLWLERVDEAPSFAEQVTCWLFGTSVSTLVLLAAGLRNLTVRRRYVDCRSLLDAHGRLDFHEELLDWLGCRDLDAARVRRHLDALATTFDATSAHVDPSFRFAADLLPAARPVAIDGGRELIDEGLHREAVFWLVATFSRCAQGLRRDAPEAVRKACDAGLRAVLRDLSIETRADLGARAAHVRARLPELDAVAGALMDATPEIVSG